MKQVMPADEKSAASTVLPRMTDEQDQPATKRDLNELRTELHSDMDRLRDDLIEKMRDMQTEVLRAFHGWAAPT